MTAAVTPTVQMRARQLARAVESARLARDAADRVPELAAWAHDRQLAVDRARADLERSLRADNPDATEAEITAALADLDVREGVAA